MTLGAGSNGLRSEKFQRVLHESENKHEFGSAIMDHVRKQ